MSAGDAVRSVLDGITAATSRVLAPFDPQSDPGVSLERLLGNLPGMAYRCRNDADWTMEFVSRGCVDLTGFEPHDLVANRTVSFGRLIHPDDQERVRRSVQTALLAGRQFRVTYRIRRVDGRERWVWEQGSGVTDDVGRIEAIEGFITDITDYEELSRRAGDQERRLQAVVDQALVGVYMIRAGRFTYVNARLADIFGYSREEMAGLASVLDLVHPDDRAVVAENLRRRDEGEVDELRYEFRGRRKDGTTCDVEAHGRRVDLGDGPVVIGALLDVTERRRAQRRYHEVQKMEALGHLAAGVAHDFNNILTVVKASAQILLTERPADPDLARDLEDILSAVNRGAALSRQLTAFGNPGPGPETTVSLSQAIQGLAPVLRRLLGNEVTLELDVPSDVPAVRMDRARAEEALMNLVLNARDAMPEGGRITVRIRDVPAGDETLPRSLATTDCVLLEVEDEGVGIPSDLRKRIFEPYFTTKGEQGTGLGLCNVWRMACDAGGTVEVESEVGAGSTFRITLPAAAAE